MTIICSQQYAPRQQTARTRSTSFVHPFQVDGRMEIKSRITATTIMTAAKMRMACGLLRSLKPCSNAVATRMLHGRTISAAARDSKRRDCGLLFRGVFFYWGFVGVAVWLGRVPRRAGCFLDRGATVLRVGSGLLTSFYL